MKTGAGKIGLYLILLALVAFALYMPNAEKKAHQKKVDAALEGGLPVLLEFSSTDCDTCMKMKPVVEKVAADMAGQVKVVNFFVDKNDKVAETLMQKYPVEVLPTFYVFDRDRKVVEHFEGEIPEAMLKQMLGKYTM